MVKDNQKIWKIIARDVFAVSLLVYLALSWFEFNSPGSVSNWIDHNILLVIPFSLIFLSFRRSSREKILIESIFGLIAFFLLASIMDIFWEVSPNLIFLVSATILALVILLANKKKKQISGSLERKIELNQKDTKMFLATLLAILLLGFVLRIWNLDKLGPAGDEYRHLIAMKHHQTEGFFEYYPSQSTTYLVIGIGKLFRTESLLLFRMPFVIFGTLSIFLVYLLGKKISPYIGLIAAYLFAFMPLLVGLSRYIRGYIVEIFLSLLLLNLLHANFLKKSFWLLLVKTAFLVGLFFLLAKIDQSTRIFYSAILFATYSMSYLCLTFIRQKSKGNAFLLQIFFVCLSILGIIFLAPFVIPGISKAHLPTFEYLYMLNFYNSSTTWFYPQISWGIVATLLFLPLFAKNRREESLSLFFTFLIISTLYIFYFNAARIFQERYLSIALPYFIILISTGIYAFFVSLRNYLKKDKTFLLIVVFLLIFSPLKAIQYTIEEENGSLDKKTKLPHYNSSELVEFIQENKIDLSKTITTRPWPIDYYFDQEFLTPQEKDIYVMFPEQQWFEKFDRRKVFSLSGYWGKEDIKKINSTIASHDIEHLIVHAHPLKEEYRYNSSFLLGKIDNIELIHTIDGDKQFGFYIYKINKTQ